MFKYPELFGSVAPGGAGFATEKRIQENDGAESDAINFGSGYNTWDLAKKYSQRKGKRLAPFVWVGAEEENYQSNLDFMDYLKELGIPTTSLSRRNWPSCRQNL